MGKSIELIALEGAYHEIGYQHGSMLKDKVHALSEERLRLTMKGARERGLQTSREDCLALAGELLEAHRSYAPEVFDELRGIAEGAEISLELLLIGNGYTDYRDVLIGRPCSASEAHGCTSFCVRPEAAADGNTYVGQTWDMHATAEQFVVAFHRKPKNAPASLTVTTAGGLSLIGINEHGIAVGNNNLVPTDVRPGVIYLAMIHKALAQGDGQSARRAITDAPRASGHNYYLAAPGGTGGTIWDIETTATRHETITPSGATYAHANQYQCESLKPLQAPLDPGASSPHRERRLSELLNEAAGQIDADKLMSCLSDHRGGANKVCVHNETEDAGKTCAAVVLCPESRRMWATLGNACENAPVELSL